MKISLYPSCRVNTSSCNNCQLILAQDDSKGCGALTSCVAFVVCLLFSFWGVKISASTGYQPYRLWIVDPQNFWHHTQRFGGTLSHNPCRVLALILDRLALGTPKVLEIEVQVAPEAEIRLMQSATPVSLGPRLKLLKATPKAHPKFLQAFPKIKWKLGPRRRLLLQKLLKKLRQFLQCVVSLIKTFLQPAW